MSLPCERDTARVTETLEVVSCERERERETERNGERRRLSHVKETLAVSLVTVLVLSFSE